MGFYSNFIFFYGYTSPNCRIIIKKITYNISKISGTTFDEIVDDIDVKSMKINENFMKECAQYKGLNVDNLDWYIMENGFCTLESPPSNFINIYTIKDVPTNPENKEEIIISEDILQRIKITKELEILTKELKLQTQTYWNLNKYDISQSKTDFIKIYKNNTIDQILERIEILESSPKRFKTKFD